MLVAGVKAAWSGINWVLALFGHKLPQDLVAQKQLKGLAAAETKPEERGSLVPHEWLTHDVELLCKLKSVRLQALVCVTFM